MIGTEDLFLNLSHVADGLEYERSKAVSSDIMG